MGEEYRDGEKNPLKQGWYVGVFPGSSTSSSAKAVRSLHFIRQKGKEFLAYSDKVPTRMTPDFAKNFYPLDIKTYLAILRDKTDKALGVFEQMVNGGVLTSELTASLKQTLNASLFTEGRGIWKRG